MTKVFDAYAAYYDLLYRDKDYEGETEYLHRLVGRHAPAARSILELGCGTGAHALHFARLGYSVHGIDLSEAMLDRARRLADDQAPAIRDRLVFEAGDVRTWRTSETFDAVLSLFHVFSYQTSDADIRAAIGTAAAHLRPGGILVADFWHGPGVAAIGPEQRRRVLEDERVRVTRHALPEHHPDLHRVDVAYELVVEDLEHGGSGRLSEMHRMRYFYRDEMERWLTEAGMELAAYHGWLGDSVPGNGDWAAVLVARRPR